MGNPNILRSICTILGERCPGKEGGFFRRIAGRPLLADSGHHE